MVKQECSPPKRTRGQSTTKTEGTSSETKARTARRVLGLTSNSDNVASPTDKTKTVPQKNSTKKTRATRRISRMVKHDENDLFNSPEKENLPTPIKSPKVNEQIDSLQALSFSPKLVTRDIFNAAASKARVLDFSSPSKTIQNDHVAPSSCPSSGVQRAGLGSPRSEKRALFSSPKKDTQAFSSQPKNSSPVKPVVSVDSPAKRSIFSTPGKESCKSSTKEDIRSPFKTPTRPAPRSPAMKGLASPVMRNMLGGSGLISPRRVIFTSPPPADVRQSPRKNPANPYSTALCKYDF